MTSATRSESTATASASRSCDPTDKSCEILYHGNLFSTLRIIAHVRFPSFDTINAGGFVFSDQFLQISTVLPSQFVYGLGEHDAPFLRNTDWNQFAMWNFDNPPFGDPVRFETTIFLNDFFLNSANCKLA